MAFVNESDSSDWEDVPLVALKRKAPDVKQPPRKRSAEVAPVSKATAKGERVSSARARTSAVPVSSKRKRIASSGSSSSPASSSSPSSAESKSENSAPPSSGSDCDAKDSSQSDVGSDSESESAAGAAVNGRKKQKTRHGATPARVHKERHRARHVHRFGDEDDHYDADNGSQEIKWQSLVHKGVCFPPPYEPHRKPLLYKGERCMLEPEAEEIATFYATKIGTTHVQNEKFNENFFDDFRACLVSIKSQYASRIKKFVLCDFSIIRAHLDSIRAKQKEKTPAERKAEREADADRLREYTVAQVDGRMEKVGNFRVEPPGLFLGRGDHPLTGKVKKRIMPEDITINVGRTDPVPPCPVPGHRWGQIVHNQTATWLASWKDSITGGMKYVFLGASSTFKGQSDQAKYEKARTLEKHVGAIRKAYTKGMRSSELCLKQLSVASYLIDKLALRMGNEKGEDEADTVGCCSLRVEHLRFLKENRIELDFLGKDSIRYLNVVVVDPLVYETLESFCSGKKPGDSVFDAIHSTKLNKHFQKFMPGLSAKVFRTYNASRTLDNLLHMSTPEAMTTDAMVEFYNKANKEVAILCNHQKSQSVSFNDQLERLVERKADLVKQLKQLERRETLDGDHVIVVAHEHVKPLFTPEMNMKEREEEKERVSKLDKQRVEKKVAIKLIESTVERTKQRIEKIDLQIRMKSDLKNVALGTSKLNYNDPRITVAWCKKHSLPIEKVFSSSLLQKFSWAMSTSEDFRF
ncbi:DNA topoisomerase 1 beta [Porphyridium purpureum]|uniref:DNA topoisomerase I n=1 Tax=Porphyridium purpureum TaxID=35688 RepID=A0A5J4Z9V6_PORPP|nr:DNA topoisomerase 1 beta [Porphyridium purpureum]|eukprot:POR1997..scf295_1